MLKSFRSARVSVAAIITGIVAAVLLLAVVVHAALTKGPASRSFMDRLAYIPAGRCTVGSKEGRPGEYPREIVVNGFWIGRWEVSTREYANYLKAVGRDGVPCQGGGNYPVAGVSREAARNYCQWLSETHGVIVRLPSEEEWEYAARGGIHGARYPWGWGAPEGRAAFDRAGPKRVGSYRPNAYGLYDMAGNVFEWCAPNERDDRTVARGGSWAERRPTCLRVFHRAFFSPDYADADVGFRIVVEGDRALTIDEG